MSRHRTSTVPGCSRGRLPAHPAAAADLAADRRGAGRGRLGGRGAVGDGWSLRLLAELVGFGLLASFVVEFVVVGGSAARGLLRAGERGDRLAGGGRLAPAAAAHPPPAALRSRQR
jgi:hypothetical protein